MSTVEYINFVLTGDRKYVMPIGVTITSILKNLKTRKMPRFFLFTTDFEISDLDKLAELKKVKNCEIVNVPMTEYLHYFKDIDVSKFKLSYVNLVCYYRLLMLKILPTDVDKCFYIDGDMIIDTNLAKLEENMPHDKIASVVVESFAMNNKEDILSHCFKMKDFYNFQKSPLKYPYFNAGFMLLNIKKAKKEKLFEKALLFLANNPNPPYADQDTLNAVIGQKYAEDMVYLPPAYNVFCDFGINKVQWKRPAFYDVTEIQTSIRKPKICHYAGGHKPWLDDEQNHGQLWWKYCRLSPWKDTSRPNKLLNSIIVKYYLFNHLNVLEIIKQNKDNRYIIKIKLFKWLPVIKIKQKAKRTHILLFNFIPFLIKKDI